MFESETLFSLALLMVTSLPVAIGWTDAPHITDQRVLVFVSDKGNRAIYMANVTDDRLITELNYTKLAIGEGFQVTGIRYDPRHRWLFWADYTPTSVGLRKGEIDAVELDSSVSIKRLGRISSLDMDETYYHTIYWLGYDSFRVNKGNYEDQESSFRICNLVFENTRPYGIKYDNAYRRLFWTDGEIIWNVGVESGEDQEESWEDKEEFVNVGATAKLRDTYIDHGECRIYWFTREGVIESMNLNGTDRQVHYSDPSTTSAPYVIYKFGDLLYWTDQARGGIGAINITSGKEVGFAGELFGNGHETFDLSNQLYGLTIGRKAEVNYCCAVTCLGGGTCVNQETEALCICLPTLNGSRCELDVDECSLPADTYPCDVTYGTCNNTYGSYECSCQRGYHLSADNQCVFTVNCTGHEPCLNGGTCMDDTCVCMFGFMGYTCELVNCTGANPCLNGGTCMNNTCVCMMGFKGSTCEVGPTDAPTTENVYTTSMTSPVSLTTQRSTISLSLTTKLSTIALSSTSAVTLASVAGETTWVPVDMGGSASTLHITNGMTQECPPLASPVNGRTLVSGLSVGDVALFTCYEGFELSHEITLTCEPGGAWSTGDIPCCNSISQRPTATTTLETQESSGFPAWVIVTIAVLAFYSIAASLIIILLVSKSPKNKNFQRRIAVAPMEVSVGQYG